MRIELNAGGLGGFITIAEFGLSLNALDNNIDSMIESFQTVKNAVGNLPGGVGNLAGAVSNLQTRIEHEQAKKQNLADMGSRFSSFLDLAITLDRTAGDLVKQSKEEFYRMNEHLRPPIPPEDKKWFDLAAIQDALSAVGDFIVESIQNVSEWIGEHWDEALTVVGTVLLVGAGIVIIIAAVVTGGAIVVALGLVAGGMLIGGGAGLGFAGYRSYRDNGDVKMEDLGKGFSYGVMAGGVIGGFAALSTLLPTIAPSALSKTAVTITSLGLQGFGSSIGTDFFTQAILEGDSIGLENFNFTRNLIKGLEGMVLNIAIGGLCECTGLKDLLTGKSLNFLENLTTNRGAAITILSTVPFNAGENLVQETSEFFLDWIIDPICGMERESFDLGKFLFKIFLGTGLDTIGESVEVYKEIRQTEARIQTNIDESAAAREASNFEKYKLSEEKIEKEVQADRIRANVSESAAAREASNYHEFEFSSEKIMKEVQADRIRANVSESAAAREASNFFNDELSSQSAPISREGLTRLLKGRGLTDEQVQISVESFNKFSPNRDPNLGQDVMVRHTAPGGETQFLYSTRGDASGIYVSNDLMVENKSGINKLALPSSNSMLVREEVLVKGDVVTGTVAPQPAFTAEAGDGILRGGGAEQTLTNGGIRTGAVVKTGNKWSLIDTAQRLKMIGDHMESPQLKLDWGLGDRLLKLGPGLESDRLMLGPALD